MSGLPTPQPPTGPPPEAVLRLLRRPGMRQASCPAPEHFSERIGAADLAEALWSRHVASEILRAPLSVDVHIPFCESPWHYREGSIVVTRHHERALPYVEALDREVGLVVDQIGACRSVSRLHLGGGSPTFLDDAELSALMGVLRRNFFLGPQAELAIEVDPQTVDAGRLAHLRSLGFDRIGLGVQDFDADVQKALQREHSFELARDLMAAARGLGFASIHVDLVYGLPRQTPDSFRRTLAQAAKLRPDRIALHASTAWAARSKAARRIDGPDIPTLSQQAAMLADALALYQSEGYDCVSLDHFALPDDPLAVARREGRLHWSLQGYSAQPEGDLIGLGVSAIGHVGDCFYQNARTLPTYYAALDENRLPVQRGHLLDADDRVRRDIIMALTCRGEVEFADIRARHGVDVATAFAAPVVRLARFAAQGLLELRADRIRVTPAGWYAVHAIAREFERPVPPRPTRDRAALEPGQPLKGQRPPARPRRSERPAR
jgi:oxygen-independent coproporphyrinogen-3 oxidase